MRRALLILSTVIALSLVLAVPNAGALPGNGADVVAQSAQTAQSSQSGDNQSGGAPSIVPSPNERGTNNFGGLAVGAILIGGWGLAGYLIYRQAQRRRAAEGASAT